MIDEIIRILDVHRNSYFNYKKQARPIISLLEKYFTKDDLIEFLSTNKISKMEHLSKDYSDNELEFLAENSEAVKMYIKSVGLLK